MVTVSLAWTQKGSFTHVEGCIYLSCEFRCGRKLGLLGTQNPCNGLLLSLLGASLSWDMLRKKSKAKAAVQAPGDPHPPPKPAPLALSRLRIARPGHGIFECVGCSVLGRGAEPPQFWVLLIWLEPGISHVTWVHYDATMCLPCFVCSILPVLHFLRFDLCVL